jgi:AcrR family transcriptional regulator
MDAAARQPMATTSANAAATPTVDADAGNGTGAGGSESDSGSPCGGSGASTRECEPAERTPDGGSGASTHSDDPGASTRAGHPASGSRRRGAELERAILTAVWEELAAVGYSGLTIEGVAERARTSRTVLYRRWSTRAQLVVAAMTRSIPEPEDLPDTGDLRTDVITLLVRLESRFEGLPPDAVRGLLFEVMQDPEAIAIRERVIQPQCTDLVMILLARAAARGEIDASMIKPRIASVPKDLVRNEYLTGKAGRVTQQVIEEIIDDVFLPLVRHRPPSGS